MSVSVPDPSLVCPFDHHDPEHDGDELYSFYERLLAHPVAWSPHHGGFWMVSGYEEIQSVLKDHETFSSAEGAFLPDNGYRGTALEQDPPEHGPFRKLYAAGVGRPAVERKLSDLTAMIRRVVADFVRAGGGDARAGISEKLSVEGVALMYGLSPELTARLRDLTIEAWRRKSSDPDAFLPLMTLLLGEVAARRVDPRDDFLTEVSTVMVDGRTLTDEEIGNLLVGAVIAGHETTLNASAILIATLAKDRDLQRRLREDRSGVAPFVEETLRYRAPAHLLFRTVTRPVEVAGVRMSKGDKVAAMFAAANHDPSMFKAPNRFDLDRKNVTNHLAFGWGIHRCVGAFMAQTELRVLTQALLDTGTFTLTAPARMGALEGGLHLGVEQLMLKLETT